MTLEQKTNVFRVTEYVQPAAMIDRCLHFGIQALAQHTIDAKVKVCAIVQDERHLGSIASCDGHLHHRRGVERT